eukprot:CAMPEP_0119209962 /NCGR_PEP_ID=MMETSP1327-20130426/1882_1 /TAXON_ID=38833 /ORGANISM="Micromonas pusilla, Strain RCC2306" /LENGTH=91 /DNA_ID=CAMNT_0007206903 /DNA_START=52 /DNA_END=324 /DNA_ORIENTATION=-
MRCAQSLTYFANPVGLTTTGKINVASASAVAPNPTHGRAVSPLTKSSPHHRATTRQYAGAAPPNHSKLRSTSSTWPVSLGEERDDFRVSFS